VLAEWDLTDDPRTPDVPAARVTIPGNFTELVRTDLPTAQAERLRVRAELEAAFADGLQIAGFDRATNAYLLS